MIHFHDFTKITGVPKRRSTFGYEPKRLFTLNEGALYPFFCEEALPSDIWKLNLSFATRGLQPFAHPVLDDMYQDFYFFFVPFRVLWKYWEQFCGVDEPSAYTDPVEYTLPVIHAVDYGPGNVARGSILNGLGVPAGAGISGLDINVLPLAAFIKCWSDWFRDENLQDKPAILETIYNAASGADITIPSAYGGVVAGDGAVTSVNKYHDVFTSCLPSPTKGPEVTLPLGTFAPVIGKGGSTPTMDDTHPVGRYLFGRYSGGDAVPLEAKMLGTAAGTSAGILGSRELSDGSSSSYGNFVENSNLVADLTNATSATINELRNSIALQTYFEALALGGSRYTELIRSMFGEAPRDARLQRAEYLGGCHERLNIQQVSAQGASGTIGTASKTDAGSLGAFSVTSNSHNTFVKHIEEPGLVLGLTAIRVKHSYSQGLPKLFRKLNRFDYYWPQFDRIGNVPVPKEEIAFGGTGTFGFQEAHYEYRHIPNRISGDIASLVPAGVSGNTADMIGWTFQDVYSAAPTLSSSWVKEDKGRVQQTLAGTSEAPQFIVDTCMRMSITRPMSVNSIPSSLGM